MSANSDLERAFDTQFKRLGTDLPTPEAEYRFAKPRQFRFDRAWPGYRVAVELEGMNRPRARIIRCQNCNEIVRARRKDGSPGRPLSLGGYHQRYSVFKSNIEKYNLAVERGWFVLRFIHDDVYADPFSMVDLIRKVLNSRLHRVPEVRVLTPKESEILRYVAAGYTGPDIARRLGVRPTTVKQHMGRTREKLNVRTRAAAVARAIDWGLITTEDVPWYRQADTPFQSPYLADSASN